MKNVLYTVFPSTNFLPYILSFAKNVVVYEAPADAEAANDFPIGFNKEHAIENVTLDSVNHSLPSAYKYLYRNDQHQVC